MTLAGQALQATSTTVDVIDCELPVGSLALTPQAPQFSHSKNFASGVPLVTFAITGQAPSASVTERVYSALSASSLVMEANAPSFTNTSNEFVSFPSRYNEQALYHYAQAGIRTFP